ncbi:MAG: hypothetical protein AB1330_02440 [Bacillota bacterium]
MADSSGKKKPVGAMLTWGILSAGLYAAVFLNVKPIMNYFTAVDGLQMFEKFIRASALVALAIAFSLIYGNFAGTFWEVVGIQPKKKEAGKEGA